MPRRSRFTGRMDAWRNTQSRPNVSRPTSVSRPSATPSPACSVDAIWAKSALAKYVACRYGGEEFLLLMPGAGLSIAHARAEERSASFAALCRDGFAAQTTLSAGIAVFPVHGRTQDDLIRAADGALYEAKR